MAGVIYQLHPHYYQPWSEHSILILTESHDYQKFIWSDNYCVAKHSSFCKDFHTCKYHILLCYQEPHELFEKLKHLQFKYATVNDLYGFYMCYIHDTIVVSDGDIASLLFRAIEYQKKYPKFIPQPSVLKKKVARKAIKMHIKSDLTRTVATQTVDEQLQKRITTIMEGRYTSEFFRIIDAFIDHHGVIENSNISFCVKK